MRFFTKRVLLWPLLLSAALVVAAGVVAGSTGVLSAMATGSLFGASAETRNTQVIHAITRTEQVALLSLSIEGIEERKQSGKIFGMDVPGSGRAAFIRYGFDAKVGIDGKRVTITQTAESTFLVAIPEFIFIGLDNQSFELAAENNDVLSWTTPEIDKVKMVDGIVDDGLQRRYIDEHREDLQDQARAFYSGIITSVAPEVTLEFEFRK